MTPEPPSPVEAPPDPLRPSDRSSGPATGYGALARRISSRTTDLVAIAVVLIGGMSIGRQLVEWWRVEPESLLPAAPHSTGGELLGADGTPVTLEFGGAPLAMTREIVACDPASAIDRLVARCESTVKSAAAGRPIVNAAAQALVARAADLEPVVEEPGVWRVYRLDEFFPLVLGLRRVAEGEIDRAAAPWGLICWGMAVPSGGSHWALYTFLAAESADGALPEFALPGGARKILGLRGEAGDGLIAFGGEGRVEQWMSFFDREFERCGLARDAAWESAASGWSARFESPESGTGRRIEIGLSRDANGGLTGLIQLGP